ncbi:MAG: aspartate aminotransferase family protein [Gammaproteobacteria bacterium]|nr:aspartate aminotransferase family protein [Gammaproteobacteria bacterium]MBU1655850.1 aspartate aminotransferase family protein [Gammaproteobacteria bacterium]MBU1960085.1 aspartate aminotransferase family protein [Gammaproteobacteria bacterium]
MAEALMATYKRQPVEFVRGDGPWLWDSNDKRYLDAISGIAVCSLGHAHAAVQKAICEQASRLVHTSNLYGIPNQQRLGERLTALSGMDRAFFCNSGAEANEAAIKLARLQGHRKGIEVPAIIVMEESFHGRTLATLSATGSRKVQAGFEPLVQGFVRVPFGDMESLAHVAATRQDIAAVLVEPVQGEGGVNIPSADYLNEVRKVCDKQGWLMMLDEIQTGMGRTGRYFAHQHNGILPDVMTLAKALGNGVPIGACLARGEAAGLFTPGSHGTTFGGNPLACAAALAVVETMETEAIPERAAVTGARLLDGFKAALGGMAGISDIRGLGMMIGIELDRPCTDLVARALDQGMLINVTADRVVRLLPPLNIEDAVASQLVDGVAALIRDFLKA